MEGETEKGRERRRRGLEDGKEKERREEGKERVKREERVNNLLSADDECVEDRRGGQFPDGEHRSEKERERAEDISGQIGRWTLTPNSVSIHRHASASCSQSPQISTYGPLSHLSHIV